MNAHTQRLSLHGAAGLIEVARDNANDNTNTKADATSAASPSPLPAGQRPMAFIAHPHPLFGGTMDNKVVQTLARAFVASGWDAVRFNFRGVGRSEGSYDEGRGELDDFLGLVRQLAPEGPLAIAGFSFGAFVASHALDFLHQQQRRISHAVLVGTACSRFDVAPIAQPLQARTLILHGERDETVPLESVMDWARPQLLPVTVVPGGGHFFHGQLALLKALTQRHLQTHD